VRVWDVPPEELCRAHLLGEHRELHAIWTILTQDKKGYRNHPETKRWVGKQSALFARHEALVSEMTRRGHRHRSDLDAELAIGADVQRAFIDSVELQRDLLAAKPCGCYKPAQSGGA
jgi:hypothetical protein